MPVGAHSSTQPNPAIPSFLLRSRLLKLASLFNIIASLLIAYPVKKKKKKKKIYSTNIQGQIKLVECYKVALKLKKICINIKS